MYAQTNTEYAPTNTMYQPAPAQGSLEDTVKDFPEGTRKPPKLLIWIEWYFHQAIGTLMFVFQLGMLAAYVSNVADIPELLEPPYSPLIMPSLVIPLVGTILAMLYVISVYIPKLSPLHSRPGYWLATAIFRVVLMILFILGVALQSTWMALPLGSCENKYSWRGLTHWPDGTPPIFYMLPGSRVRGKLGSRWQSACDRLVMIWGFEIATIILLPLFILSAVCLYRGLDEGTNQPSGFWQKMKSARAVPRGQPDPQEDDLEIQPLNRTYQR